MGRIKDSNNYTNSHSDKGVGVVWSIIQKRRAGERVVWGWQRSKEVRKSKREENGEGRKEEEGEEENEGSLIL